MKYALLIKPMTTITFVDDYLKMCQSELTVFFQAYDIECKSIQIKKINKASFLIFELSKALVRKVLYGLYDLSFFHILFNVDDNDCFNPLMIDREICFGDDFSTRLKYNGKTNEQITRLMMTIALNLSDFSSEKNICLLDPLCGRGTTLFEGMISGFNVFGVERDNTAFNELSTYVTRYVKESRIKHTTKRGKALYNGILAGEFYEIEYAIDKVSYKTKNTSLLKVLRGDTTHISNVFKKNSMHIIVTDLPYNIQHRAKKKNDRKEKSSSGNGIVELLSSGLMEWDAYLKKGGCIAISWNTYTDKRETMVKVFEDRNYEVITKCGLDDLSHRVSQAINRDILFAIKK